MHSVDTLGSTAITYQPTAGSTCQSVKDSMGVDQARTVQNSDGLLAAAGTFLTARWLVTPCMCCCAKSAQTSWTAQCVSCRTAAVASCAVLTATECGPCLHLVCTMLCCVPPRMCH